MAERETLGLLDIRDISPENINAMRAELDRVFTSTRKTNPKQYPKTLHPTKTQSNNVVLELYKVCREDSLNGQTGIPTYLFADSDNTQPELPFAA